MYALYGIDTVVRITAALLLLFVMIPRLAWRRPESLGRVEWFFWNLGVGLTLLTLLGQFFTLLRIASAAAYVATFAVIIVVCRARSHRMSPLQWLRNVYASAVLLVLEIIDGRRSVGGTLRDVIVAATANVGRRVRSLRVPLLAWGSVIVAAGALRLYRPFASANLGFSDTYVHLYLMRLLDEGRQVDPAWGPYPRGMHFLLLAIERLTNVEPILMMNFFGAFSGVLMAVAAAYAARRVTGRTSSALVAGVLFATMTGGASQYFVLGGSVSSSSTTAAEQALAKPYSELASAGEFDVLFTAFQRQTSTLPQELAIVLLLPGALFLLDWLRDRNRWRLAGFVGCTAATAAIHSGVVIPLVALCAAAAAAVLICRVASLRRVLEGAAAGAVGVLLGSSWMLGFIRYRSVAGRDSLSSTSHVGATALYYFPFLRSFSGDRVGEETAYMMLTPFLIAIVIAALLLAAFAAYARETHALWIAFGTLFFVLAHAASRLGIPEIIEVRRNATWLALTIAVIVPVAVAAVTARVPQRIAIAVPALIVAAWVVTVPNLAGAAIRERLLDYSGYSATTYAVLRISQELEPFTWTLVSYGQEYPMVLGRGFHLNGADFLERYDPAESPLPIPTPYVFVAVEKRPHRFEINNWTSRFGRASVVERLNTWCQLYGMTHGNIRIFLEDENVRIYEIRRPVESALASAQEQP